MITTSLLWLALSGQASGSGRTGTEEATVTSQASAGPAPAAAPTASKWTGSVGLGLIYLSGNASAVTFSSTALAERKTEHWIYGLKATGVYGRARAASADPDSGSQVIALGATLQLRGDRRLTQAFSIYVLGGAETDHVKSVEFRGYGETGGSIIWLDTKEGELSKTFLRTDLAFRYSKESRFQYYPTPQALPDATLYAPRFGAAFRYNFSKEVNFLQDVEVLPNVVGDSRVLANSMSKLSTRLSQSFSLGVAFSVAHDSRPAPGKKRTDTALNVALDYTL